MSVVVLDRERLNGWIDACIASHAVVGVQAKGERYAFDALALAKDLRLDYDVTILPPKKYFQPPREALATFDCGACRFESALDDRPLVLFGVHPYDMVAIAQMDVVFADKNPDIHYARRRANATIVVSDVETPSPNVFAGCMNTAVVSGGDVRLTRIGGGTYVVETLTGAGEKLLALAKGAVPATATHLALRAQAWERIARSLRKHALKPAPVELPSLLEKSDGHPVWEEKAQRCFSCGSCTLVCPTCYCFDVHDEVDWSLRKGERVRTWDGCQLTGFATVAGNHNFRKQRHERYRHRYYRKGKYMPDKFGQVACVGCGRCITACTAKIANPVEIFNRLQEGR